MTDAITSVQNPRVKAAVRLRDARERRQAGLFLIDGIREIERALDAGVEIVEAFIGADTAAAHQLKQRLCRPRAVGPHSAAPSRRPPTVVHTVTPAVFAKLAFGDRKEGMVAVARMPPRTLERIALPGAALVVVLEGVEKPGNVGAVLRTADAAGASAVVVADGGTDLYNPNCIRASLGGVFTLPVATATSAESLAWLRRQGVRIVAARVDATAWYTAVDFTQPTAIVLGSEARGLTAAWQAADITAVRLPMVGRVDSLNVSATAAVLLYEARRQRDQALKQP